MLSASSCAELSELQKYPRTYGPYPDVCYQVIVETASMSRPPFKLHRHRLLKGVPPAALLPEWTTVVLHTDTAAVTSAKVFFGGKCHVEDGPARIMKVLNPGWIMR